MSETTRTVLVKSVKNSTARVMYIAEGKTRDNIDGTGKYKIPIPAFPSSPNVGEMYEFDVDDAIPTYRFQRKLDAENEINALYQQLADANASPGDRRNRLSLRLRELQNLEAERMSIYFKQKHHPGESLRVLARAGRVIKKYEAILENRTKDI
ncbi:MAG: hypothetical protein HY513_05920 [Candidatus Aenigmarchaeota archaeon]|nr:hypothetical protein [Candidatus Aenigmarchaeota archaeon]